MHHVKSGAVIVSPRDIRASLCQESQFVENGRFYLPDGIVNARQIFRIVGTEVDESSGRRVLTVSDEAYVSDGGKFVPLLAD